MEAEEMVYSSSLETSNLGMHNKKIFCIFAITCIYILYGCEKEKRLQSSLEITSEELRSAIIEYDSLLHTSILERFPSLDSTLSKNAYLLTVYETDLNGTIKNSLFLFHVVRIICRIFQYHLQM